MLVEREESLSSREGGSFVDVRDLRVHFKATISAGISAFSPEFEKLVRAVDGVSLTINRGEILSLVGESGSGKTTLGRSIVGLARPTSGEIVINGTPVNFHKRKALRTLWKTTQMIFQDPYSTFNPLSTIYDTLLVPVKKFKLAKSDEDGLRLVETALTEVGLNHAEIGPKYPNELSGGQRQRAAIARALIVQPKIIVADEPVSMLDVSLRAGILELLKVLNEKNNLTIIFITHDLAVAQYISDRIAVMYRGKIVELAKANEAIQSPLHPYTELLLRSAPRLKGAQGWSEKQEMVFRTVDQSKFKGCAFYPRCPLGMERCVEEEPQLVQVESGHYVSCHVRASGLGPKPQSLAE